MKIIFAPPTLSFPSRMKTGLPFILKKRMKTNPTQTKLIQRPKNQMVTWPMAPTETIFLVQIKTHFYKSEIPSSYSKDRERSLVVMQHYPHLMTISQFLKTLN